MNDQGRTKYFHENEVLRSKKASSIHKGCILAKTPMIGNCGLKIVIMINGLGNVLLTLPYT